MSIKDIKSNLVQALAMVPTAISSNTTTNGAIIDTEGLDNGIMFGLLISNRTDGAYILSIFESDDSGMSGATVIAPESDIGVNDITGGAYNGVPVSQTADTASGAEMNTVGVFGNKRYLRASVVSSGTSTGATATVISTAAPELMPA